MSLIQSCRETTGAYLRGQVMTFTLSYLEETFKKAMALEYSVVSCATFASSPPEGKILINRIDIDVTCVKAVLLARIFHRIGADATFFVRLHAREYNPFEPRALETLKEIIGYGFEIGLHSEILRVAGKLDNGPKDRLSRDISTLESQLGIVVTGVAAHDHSDGFNDSVFWKNYQPSSVGLLYEAYQFCQGTVYISDSEFDSWKVYHYGKLLENDRRGLHEHVEEEHPILYVLMHPIVSCGRSLP